MFSGSNPVALIKWFCDRPFPGKVLTILEQPKETFFLEFAFADVVNCGLQACNIREKTWKRCFKEFWNLKTSLPLRVIPEKYL